MIVAFVIALVTRDPALGLQQKRQTRALALGISPPFPHRSPKTFLPQHLFTQLNPKLPLHSQKHPCKLS